MQYARRATFGLHLLDKGYRTPDVLAPSGAPGIGKFCHAARGGDRVDRHQVVDAVRHRSRRLRAIDGCQGLRLEFRKSDLHVCMLSAQHY